MHTTNGNSFRAGYVVSDLHLFAARSLAHRHFESLHDAAARAEFFVFNGDTFDFKWSVHGPHEASVGRAVHWIESLVGRFPACHFYFLSGNHDCIPIFVEAIERLTESIPNLSYHPHYLTLGDVAFLHGDVTDRDQGAAGLKTRRARIAQDNPRHPLLGRAYGALTHTRIHRLPGRLRSRRKLALRIERYFNEVEPQRWDAVRQVYFGHTHEPFSDFEHNGRLFHNTGSPIRGLKFRMPRIEIAH